MDETLHESEFFVLFLRMHMYMHEILFYFFPFEECMHKTFD